MIYPKIKVIEEIYILYKMTNLTFFKKGLCHLYKNLQNHYQKLLQKQFLNNIILNKIDLLINNIILKYKILKEHVIILKIGNKELLLSNNYSNKFKRILDSSINLLTVIDISTYSFNIYKILILK